MHAHRQTSGGRPRTPGPARHHTMIAAVLCVVVLFSGRLASSDKSFSYGGQADVSVDSQSAGFSQQFTVRAADILPKPPLLTGPQTAQSSGHRAGGQQKVPKWEVLPLFPPPPPPPRPARKKASTQKKAAPAGTPPSSTTPASAGQTAPANKKPAAASTNKKQASTNNKKKAGRRVSSSSASAAASILNSQQAAYGLDAGGQTAPAIKNPAPAAAAAAAAASTKKEAAAAAAAAASTKKQAAAAAAAASTKKQAASVSASASAAAASSLSSQQAAYGLNPAGEPEYGLNQKAIDDIIREHNVFRARDRVPPLTWNATLAKYSQDYAESKLKGKCEMLHSSSPYGENLMQSEGDGLTWKTAVDDWSDEKKSYHYGSNSCDPGMECGHYRAVVWKGTTSVGCGRVKCKNGDAIVMCSYWPAGNYEGQKPF